MNAVVLGLLTSLVGAIGLYWVGLGEDELAVCAGFVCVVLMCVTLVTWSFSV